MLVLTSKPGIEKGNRTMDKEEILAKSRKENRNQDMFEKEVIKDGATAGAFAAATLATGFFILQIFTGGGINYGLYAVVFSIPAATFFVKAVRLKRRHEAAMAAFYTVFVLMLSIAHIYNLITLPR